MRAPGNGARKFVLATTLAETSVTIGGVRHVVDPGLAKARGCDARGFEALRLAPTSRAQADQPAPARFCRSRRRAAGSLLDARREGAERKPTCERQARL